MDAFLIAMLVAIGVFLVLMIVGLVFLLRAMRSLLHTTESLQTSINEEMSQLMDKQEAAMEKVAHIEMQSRDLSDAANRVTESVRRLNNLLNEASEIQARLRNPFSSLFNS
ncbi:MAG: DUF948 domain-containing protein [Actinobacteria bacterium]|nr:DUF948 domain-containing protein [Actinomycetota bacterium]